MLFKSKYHADIRPTADDIVRQLDSLGSLVRAAQEIVSLSRHWFPVKGHPLAHAKRVTDIRAVQEVWNAAHRLEKLLYPPELLELSADDKIARTKGEAHSVYDDAAFALAWPIRWVRIGHAVADLARRHDDLLRHLDWLRAFLGGPLPRRGMRPKPQTVSPQFLDLLEDSATYMRDVLDQPKRGAGSPRRPRDGRPNKTARVSEDDIEAMRRAIEQRGRNAKAVNLIRVAGLSEQRGRDALRWLEAHGEYVGFSRRRPARYR
jgi:hypothetical protein